jgi:NAD(P)-dependent dehydrogenase (short-subunit alcohol dehydrogenase family)
MTEIKGRVALVTGGGSGIGRGLAMALAAEGASVVVVDILKETAERVAQEIKDAGGKAAALACDVSDRAAVARMKAEANAAFGKPVTLMLANAGVTCFDRITDMTEQDVDWIIQVNLMGVTNCILAFYPDMVAARDGHIFATASTAGLLPSWVPYHAPYSGAKLGIIGLMLNLRTEASEKNVGCTVLCPGGVVTGMKANNAKYRPDRFGGPSDEEVKIPEGFFMHADLKFRPAEEVAQMCMNAIRNNRAMVITDPTMRAIFDDTYVKIVHEAFDDVDAFEKTLG